MLEQYTLDELFMQRCIVLAKKGIKHAAPNPMVGSVIVHNNQIIGEGYHQKSGEAHAEVNAIASVKDKSLLAHSTIYVSLEPCAHYGKTPPCADLIISHKIPKVVIGMQDPFAKVNGLGIEKLKSTGCEVIVGILENECKALNKAFITQHEKKRPYIILKWAETKDGFIDKERTDESEQQPNWITNEVCRSLVHKWRTEVQAIMIGPQTALVDNPELNVRSWTGPNPIRVVIDRYLRLPENLKVFDQSTPTLIFNTKKEQQEPNLAFIRLGLDNFIQNVFTDLYNRNIQSVFVEGGQTLLQHLIDENLWDEARVFIGNVNFNKGLKAPIIHGKIVATEKLKDNHLTLINNF